MVIGEEMKGGGSIDTVMENGEWILILHTTSKEVYRYKDTFSNILDALHIKKVLEDEFGDGGSLKMLYVGKDILWIK